MFHGFPFLLAVYYTDNCTAMGSGTATALLTRSDLDLPSAKA